jgi:hypothetical protein
MKKKLIATVLISLLTGCSLTACGGGSATSPQAVVPPVDENKPWSLTKISSAGSVLSDATGCGSYDIVSRGDLNNDGHDDILIGPKARYQPANGCSDPGFTKPIVAYYNPSTKTYSFNPATQAAMPEMQWTSIATIQDFNGDGHADIFAVGSGTDYGQPCGEAPILMLGSSNGLVNMSHLLPRFSSYSHQATWGDFNNDGKTDFVILNNNWVPTNPTDPKFAECSYRRHPGSNESYLITSTGDSWTYSALRVSDRVGNVLIDGNQSFNSAVAGDINNDGNTDIVVLGSNWGSLEQKTITLIGNGRSGFVAESIFVEKPFGNNTVGINPSLRQLNGSGPLELIVNYAEHPGGPALPFQKSLYKVFSYSTLTSTWSNVTDQYLTNKNSAEADLTYCARFYWVDLNADSKDDFVCTTINPFRFDDTASMSPRFWVRTADNKFEPAYHEGFSLVNRMASPTPVRVDGKVKIVGMSTKSFRSAIQLDIAE